MTYVLEDGPDGVDLVVTGDWSTEAESCFTDGRADGLILNYARGFHERDLAFIAGLPLRRLEVLARTIKDLTPIHALSDSLEALDVQSALEANLELERLPNLRSLSINWQQIKSSLRFAQNLECLLILSYSEADLAPLTVVPKLKSVAFKDRPQFRSLEGVQELPVLQSMAVHLGQQLQDINALRDGNCSNFEVLQLSSCKKITDFSVISMCTSLKFLDVSEGAEISSVQPLAILQRLERLYLYGSTKVVDGDLSCIAHLPRLKDFRMMNRRHYRPSVKEVQAALGAV